MSNSASHALPSIPGYTVTAKIYAKNRTAVYQAVDERDGKSVVIKVLAATYPSISELIRFRNQYIMAQNLVSPGIVKPLTLLPWKHSYALVMEDVGGIALRDYLQTCDRLSTEQILTIALQLADSLHHLSQHRIIHKDINPANILIHPDTHQIWLMDFSLASLLPRERQELQSPGTLEGTLAYIAPEQTGRMNRGIDYRADFYGLGVTLYELLTGELPFHSDDPMDLIHSHIAKIPVPPCEATVASFPIPKPLSDIVLKLMAKNAEDRYQSALGLKHDLQQCLGQWKASGQIEAFELGQQDRCDRFLIPEKLYGREAEVQTLLDAFDRVAQGSSELMLVAGYSGVGKTAVINEVHKPIVEKRGYFVKGKCDQFNRNIPFSAFVQVFRDLMWQLLGESAAQLQMWKARILTKLGDNGQVLIDVMPELEAIIGPQPPVPELSGSAAQNRFNLLFEKFIAIFATQDHPLVMFLDDLQWVDSASLNLLNVLMADNRTGYLLLLGAYRDNEVFAAHPLMLALADLEKQNTTLSTITLAPLSASHINQLVAETLSCAVALAAPLTDIVYQKTIGNPFFTIQFLKGLHGDGLITFDDALSYWECDLVQVRDAALTANVVEFMVGRLHKLPSTTQNVLKLAACIGNQFDLGTLAIICETSLEAVAADLWIALQEGLMLPQTQMYKFFQDCDEVDGCDEGALVEYRFLHDRVQQAAYALIPEHQKNTTHYRIGQQLLQGMPTERQEDQIFELVGHLNFGLDLITEQIERDALAQLNLVACRKARAATAYAGGREYARLGLLFLGHEAWDRHYETTLAFHNLAAELAMLCSDFEATERLAGRVLSQTRTVLEQESIYHTRILAKITQNQPAESIELAREFLQKFGVIFPDDPAAADVQQTITEIEQLIRDRPIHDLSDLPQMKDEAKVAIVNIANAAIAPAYVSGSPLLPLVIALPTKLSIQYGNTAGSAFAYACYPVIACNLGQDIHAGVDFAELSIQLARQQDAKVIKSTVLGTAALFALHRRYPTKQHLKLAREGFVSSLEVGNLEFAGRTAYVFCVHAFWCGQPLRQLAKETSAYCESLVQLKQPGSNNHCLIHWQSILNLLHPTMHPHVLSGSAIQEENLFADLIKANDFMGLFYFYLCKLKLAYLFSDLESACQNVAAIKRYLTGGIGLVGEPAFYFYDSLVILASIADSAADMADELDCVTQNQALLQAKWANYAPMNHQHKVDLVEAEKCRVLGRKLEAIDYYDRAIAGAKANEYIQEEALANELAAKFCLDWGKEAFAAVYLSKAYDCYDRWGAKAKTHDLATRYAELLQDKLQHTKTVDPLTTLHSIAPLKLSVHSSDSSSQPSTDNVNAALDLTTLFKSAQALSESIDLPELLAKLATMMLQTSGAERLALLLPDADNSWQVKVTATAETTQLGSESLADNAHLPVQLIRYVQQTQEILAIDGLEPSLPVVDAYLEHNPHRSVLCIPLLHQSKLVSLLYLEHHSLAGVFSRDRITILNFLCAQAAISLENALLNQALEQKLETQTVKREENEERLQQVALNVPGMIYQVNATVEGQLTILYASDYCEAIYEVSAEAMMAGYYNFRDFEHPDDQPMLNELIAECNRTWTIFDHQFRIITPSGILKWIHIISHPVRRIVDESQTVIATVWDGVMMDVSDRKAAELALQDAQAQFRRMTENVPGMIYRYILHPDGSDDLTYVSSQVRAVFELEPDIALQDTDQVWGRIHPDDIPWLGESIQDSAKTLQPFTSAYRLILPEKGIRWVQNMTTVERLDNGNVVWDGIVVDISDRVQAEQTLQDLSDRLELAIDSAQIGIWEWNFQDNYLSWDKRMFEIYGTSPATFEGTHQDWENCVHPDDLEQAKPREDEEYPHSKEFRIIRPDGSIRYILSTVTVQYGEQRQPLRVVGANIDISDRKQAQLALEEEVLRRNTIFNTSSDGIHILDLDGNLLEANVSFLNMLGYTAAEAQSLNVGDWDAQMTLEEVQASIRNYDWEKSEVLKIETLHRRKDGSVFPVEILVCAMQWKGQYSFISIARDISERKQAEEQLQHTLTQLETSNNELEAFAYSVSHDLRAPLRAINGFSQALLEEYAHQFDEDGQYYFERIQANANRMGDLIDGLLRLSRVSRSALSYTAVSLSNLAQEVLRDLQAADPDRQVELVIAAELTVIADITLMRVVMMNLLQNAWKFTSHHPTARIEFGVLSPEATEVQGPVYFVKDDGAGFDMAYQHKLFGVFERLHSIEDFGGTGIGLASVRRAIHRHGGQIWAEAAVEEGATFFFTLPSRPDNALFEASL